MEQTNKRQRKTLYASLNIENLSKTPSNKVVTEKKKRTKKVNDKGYAETEIEAATALLEMDSETSGSNSNNMNISSPEYEPENDENVDTNPHATKTKKKHTKKKNDETKKSDVEDNLKMLDFITRQELSTEDNSNISKPDARYMLLFNYAMPFAYLLDFCRNIPELQSYSDEDINNLLNTLNVKYASADHHLNQAAIVIPGLLLRGLIENGTLMQFNLLKRVNKLFPTDAVTAKKCIKFIEMGLPEKNMQFEWEIILGNICKTLDLNEADNQVLHPMCSKFIHDVALAGSHHKVYVITTICYVTEMFPEKLSKKLTISEIAQRLFEEFNVTRNVLITNVEKLKEKYQ